MYAKRFSVVEVQYLDGCEYDGKPWGVMDNDSGEIVEQCVTKRDATQAAFCYNWKQRRLQEAK